MSQRVNLKLNKEKMKFKLPEVPYMGHLRAKDVNLKLNKEKMKFKLPEVPYMGHLLTENGVRGDPAKAILDNPRLGLHIVCNETITITIRQNDTIINDNDNDNATLNAIEMWQVSDCCRSIQA